MKKRLAVLTFHQSLNYGALLQAYALRFVLNSLGADADILNYKYPCKDKIYRVLPFNGLGSLKNLIKRCFFVPKVRKKINPFIKKFLINTLSFDKSSLYKTNDSYDAFIVGSDQIWNTEITDGDTAFLLDFVQDDKKKNSYAASFGVSNLEDKDKGLFGPKLASFNKISVREEQGVGIIKDLIGKDVLQVIDPILLLSEEKWRQIAVLPEEEDFILVYLMKQDKEIIKFARNISRRTKLPLIIIANTAKRRLRGKYVFASPQEFLGYFMKARYVITNSFHGLAFSINFNKDFYAALHSSAVGKNTRLESLLNMLGLKDRLIDVCPEGPVDYEKANLILERERQKSLDFLKQIIK